MGDRIFGSNISLMRRNPDSLNLLVVTMKEVQGTSVLYRLKIWGQEFFYPRVQIGRSGRVKSGQMVWVIGPRTRIFRPEKEPCFLNLSTHEGGLRNLGASCAHRSETWNMRLRILGPKVQIWVGWIGPNIFTRLTFRRLDYFRSRILRPKSLGG
jgi:hypothetical protein